MLQTNKPFRLLAALTTTLTTNILNCAVTSLAGPVGLTLSQPYLMAHKIRISNKTASSATFSLWLGATSGNAAGTELWTGVPVPANSYFESNDLLLLSSADFLVGGSGTTTALTILIEGEIGFS